MFIIANTCPHCGGHVWDRLGALGFVCMDCGKIEEGIESMSSACVEDFQKDSTRDNMLVTIGSRAGYMDSAGYIDLPSSATGEDEFAEFAAGVIDEFRSKEWDICFDEFIEVALTEKYGNKKEEQK